MEDYIGKICPFCRAEIKEGESVKVCPSCNIPHHEDCWNANQGCATFGCPEHHEAPAPEVPVAPIAVLCTNCGTPLSEEQAFCPECGTHRPAVQKPVCAGCGTELEAGQAFCPKCGQRADMPVDAGVNAAINQFNTAVEQTQKKKKKLPLIIGAVVVVIVAVLLFGGSTSPNFTELYDEYCSSVWADVGSDNSYLSIDTNPYDWDDDGLAYPEAHTAIKNINNAIGLPESLITEMGETRSIDGRQSKRFDDEGLEVSWSYHPDKGLEVMYTKANQAGYVVGTA